MGYMAPKSEVWNCYAFKQRDVLYGIVVRLNSKKFGMELWCVLTAGSSVWNCGALEQHEVL